MDNYNNNLYHGVKGIPFLNEEGFDKLILGEKRPYPNTGKRIVDAAGFTFNDDRGFERGGLCQRRNKVHIRQLLEWMTLR